MLARVLATISLLSPSGLLRLLPTRSTSIDRRSLDLSRYESQSWFHKIDLSFPGLRLINEEPYIFAVDDFLSEDECAELVSKSEHASLHAATQGMGIAGDGRTSTGVVAVDGEIPTFRARVARLARVDPAQMQPTKLSRYEAGQAFSVHSDAVTALYDDELNEVAYDSETDLFADGNRAVHGYGPGANVSGLNRFCTVLVYLNDCDHGGHTCWLWTRTVSDWYARPRIVGAADFSDAPSPVEADILVQPKRGMAVVHFPATTLATGGLTDPNARHEGAPAVSTKHIAQTFVWNAPPNGEGDFRFMDDENLPSGRLSPSTL